MHMGRTLIDIAEDIIGGCADACDQPQADRASPAVAAPRTRGIPLFHAAISARQDQAIHPHFREARTAEPDRTLFNR